MSKDPAFLFYPADWMLGTMTMSRHQKGCYIDLLMAQFNSGPLSLEEIKTVLGNDFAVWGSLSKKFKITSNGLYFNERLETEKAKRKEFSIKQKERVEKRWNKPGNTSGNTTVLPKMLNENENENLNKKEKGVQGEKQKSHAEIFNDFRVKYPGTKRGNDTEFENFKKKHKDWKEINQTLLDTLNKQEESRKKLHHAGRFVPQWKNLQTYINNRGWEEEMNTDNQPATQSKSNQSGYVDLFNSDEINKVINNVK